jgi:hypothetical protein
LSLSLFSRLSIGFSSGFLLLSPLCLSIEFGLSGGGSCGLSWVYRRLSCLILTVPVAFFYTWLPTTI